jgi:hypothetical protein
MRLRDGFRQDTRGRITLERQPNGGLQIAYRAKLLSDGRDTTVRMAIAAADVGDLCHLIASDLMEEIDRVTKDIEALYDLAADAFGVTRDEAKRRFIAACYGAKAKEQHA